MSIVVNEDILAALKKVIDLPRSLVSLKLELAIDQCPTLECTFHAERDVTTLESKAREFRLAEPVTRRYKLVELPEELTMLHLGADGQLPRP